MRKIGNYIDLADSSLIKPRAKDVRLEACPTRSSQVQCGTMQAARHALRSIKRSDMQLTTKRFMSRSPKILTTSFNIVGFMSRA